MKTPSRFTAKEIKEWEFETFYLGVKPARPVPFSGVCILKRIKMAWLVFIGEYDALDWEDAR